MCVVVFNTETNNCLVKELAIYIHSTQNAPIYLYRAKLPNDSIYFYIKKNLSFYFIPLSL
jgi:hypothetical protein